MTDDCENCNYLLEDFETMKKMLSMLSDRVTSSRKFQLRLAKEKNDYKKRLTEAEKQLTKLGFFDF